MSVVELASGRQVHYWEQGSGPVLLLIAGLGSPKGSWAAAMARLSDTFRCIAIDNRDAGENVEERAGYSIADMADDCAAFLRALGIERASVAGSSMGGFIALHLTLNYPLLVDRLILVGTAAAVPSGIAAPVEADWAPDTLERARRRLPQTVAPGFFEAHPERLEEMAAETAQNNMTFAGYARQSAAITETHDVRSRLEEILQPTLVVHGDADAAVPLAAGEELARGIAHARLEVLPNVGHLPHRETPDAFAALVREFLTAE
ncbi:MAG: alpha/beta hydrolase [Chloroflexi bacterium]|nr:MAG: alpha/beta hydrolase [Chloroflexota bacterium]